MFYVQYGRTVSMNYQAVRYEIGFDVPSDMAGPDAYLLAEVIVDLRIGDPVRVDTVERCNGLCQRVFGCNVTDFCSSCEGVLSPRKRVTLPYNDDDYEPKHQ